MSGFGCFNCFPFTFGGSTTSVEHEYHALRESLAPNRRGYNVDDDLIDVEIYAQAAAVANIWAVNDRLANQAIPERMLEAVREWEEILRLRPSPEDYDQDRRAAIEAKLRGQAGNALVDIEATARAVLGANFVEVHTVAEADEITYWPGQNPGPPGYEWSSNRCTIGVEMTRVGLTDAEVDAKIARLHEKLDAMLPAWMTFQVGIGSDGFICDIGICDLTLL